MTARQRAAVLVGVVALLLAVSLPSFTGPKSVIPLPSGPVNDCCCSIDDVNTVDGEVLGEELDELVRMPFFRYFQVNYDRECPFWHEEVMCMGEEGDCSICPCPPDTIPEPWRSKREAFKEGDVVSSDVTCSSESPSADTSFYPLWMDLDEGACFVDLVQNPERYTGYSGFNATRIWQAIYKENCLSNECLEGRVFYRLISGFHASTTAHITAYFQNVDGVLEPNLDMFTWRLGIFPDRVNNIYFAYVFMLRAIAKISPLLENYPLESGNPLDDKVTREKLSQIVAGIDELHSCSSTFDESQMFQEEEKAPLREEFRAKFHNISRIIDCVTCETCKVHAKLQLLGMGTALRILLNEEEGKPMELHRNEVLSLFNTLQKYSDSIRIMERMRSLEADRQWRSSLDVSFYVLVCAAIVLVLLLIT